MADGSIDRRSARTRAVLHQALMSLMLKKRYERITIADICRHANVGRSTFYAHYSGKDDLRRSGLKTMRGRLAERQRTAPKNGGDRRLGFSLALFEHARDHIDLYRSLVSSRGGKAALDSFRQTLADLMREALAEEVGKGADDGLRREVVIQYLVGAYMAVLTWWLDTGAELPAQRIDQMVRRLALDGLS